LSAHEVLSTSHRTS